MMTLSTKPVFMLNSPRSFSSLIGSMISQHPELHGSSETSLFIGDTVKDILHNTPAPGFIQGLVRILAQVAEGGQTNQNCIYAYKFLLNNQDLTPYDILEIINKFTHGKRFFDKSPIHVYDIKHLNRMPKDAHFIHLVRHPKDYHDSLENYFNLKAFIPKTSPDYIYDNWVANQTNIETFLKDIPDDRKMRIIGEDVLSNPYEHMSKIAKFLNVDISKSSINAMLHPENSPYAKLGCSWAEFGNDIYFLKDAKLRPYKPKNSSLDGLPKKVVEMALSYGYK